jgi:outer membrane protein insertion porin family
LVGFWLLLILPCAEAFAQDPLYLINRETTVRGVDLRFVDTQTFEERDLVSRIASTGPTTWDKIKDILPLFRSTPRPFDPLSLQRDITRLRHFYRDNGFLFTEVDYPASQLDTTSNSIRIIFSIREGPPLIVRDLQFVGPDDRSLEELLDAELRDDWSRASKSLGIPTGSRFTAAAELLARDDALLWLKNRGYAFARAETVTRTDSASSAIDVTLVMSPGPRGRFDQITVEGNESVRTGVVLRELPFKKGDWFSSKQLTEGQRDLFGLNLFRLALTDLPAQPVDSTVHVRIRLREADPRLVSGRLGYTRDEGIETELQWSHRNFLGDGRSFNISAEAITGLLAGNSENVIPRRRITLSIGVTQPFVVVRKLSLTLSPFYKVDRDPQLHPGTGFGEFNRHEYGASTTLLYQPLKFRPISLTYLISGQKQFTRVKDDLTEEVIDRYGRSVVSLAATLGKANNFFTPTRGFIIRPFAEVSGVFVPSGVNYGKIGTDVVRFQPVNRRMHLVARVFGGRVWAFGRSKTALDGNATGGSEDSLKYSNRFNDVVFYSPNAGDTRGWASRLLGPKLARPVVSTEGDTTRFAYEPSGGNSKISASIEARFPFPGLGAPWGTAVFVDAGQVSAIQKRDPFGKAFIVDDGKIRLDNFKYSVGAGIRYATPVGFVRFDLAFKLNPSEEDLLTAEEGFRLQNPDLYPGPPPEGKFGRRFLVHLTIGQAF